MVKVKSNVMMVAGYYEFYLYIDNNIVYVLDSDCTETWYDYEDSTVYAELCVDSILDELRQDENWSDYNAIKDNKDNVIAVIAAFVADYVSEVV